MVGDWSIGRLVNWGLVKWGLVNWELVNWQGDHKVAQSAVRGAVS